MSEISQKQSAANQINAQLGGVKTPEGKAISRFNARKHGILSKISSPYEETIRQSFEDQLFEEYEPVGVMEEMLVERIAIHYVHLFRVSKAENEWMEKILNPRKFGQCKAIKEMDQLTRGDYDDPVLQEGYQPKVISVDIEELEKKYMRYETSIENRLYKAKMELERTQRMRKGEVVNAPIAINITSDAQ